MANLTIIAELIGRDLLSPAAHSAIGSLNAFETAGNRANGMLGSFASGVAQAGVALGALAFGGIVAGLGAATHAAMGFERTISNIAAVSGLDQFGEQIQNVSRLALKLGADTSFSAAESADGIEQLVKAGISIEDIMQGAARATLDLAAAGGVDVPEAARIGSSAMNTFGISGDKLAHVVDRLAGAANASNADVHDLGLALSMVGSVANIVGLDIDDTSTSLAILADMGLRGSDAGTSLKTMLLNLQPTTAKQIDMFKELGIVTKDGTNRFFDATGSIKSMAEISGILQDATAGLTDAEKLKDLQIMFGTDAVRAAAIMSGQGREAFAKMNAEIGNVTAMEVANARLNNLWGSLEKLRGSVETVAIMLGGHLTPGLKALADRATEAVNSAMPLVDIYGPMLSGALDTSAGAISGLARQFGEWFTQLTTANENGTGTIFDRLVTVLTVDLPAAVAETRAQFAGVEEFVVNHWQSAVVGAVGVVALAMVASARASIAAWLPVALPIIAVGTAIAILYEAWQQNLGGIQEQTLDFYDNSIVPTFGGIRDWLAEKLPQAFDWLINTGWPSLLDAGQRFIAWTQDTAIPTVQWLAGVISEKFAGAIGIAIQVWPVLLDLGQRFVNLLTGTVIPNLERFGDLLGRVFNRISSGDIGGGLSVFIDAVMQMFRDFGGLLQRVISEQVARISWPTVWQNARGIVSSLADNIIGTGSVLLTAVGGWLRDQFNSIDWPTVWGNARTVIGSLADTIITTGLDLATRIGTWLGEQVAQIDWMKVWSNARDVATKLADTIISTGADLGVRLGAWLREHVSRIDWVAVWGDMRARIGLLADNIISTGTDLGTRLGTWLSEQWAIAWSSIKAGPQGGMAQQVEDIVVTIKQAIAGDWSSSAEIDPLTNMFGNLVVTIKNLSETVVKEGTNFINFILTLNQTLSDLGVYDNLAKAFKDIGEGWDVISGGFRDNGPAVQGAIEGLTPNAGALALTIRDLSVHFKDFGNWFRENSPAIRDTLMSIGVAFDTISKNGPSVVGVVLSLVAAFAAFKAVVAVETIIAAAAALSPLGLAIGGVVLAIGLLATAWVNNWGDIQGKTAVAVQFINDQLTKAKTDWETIAGAWTTFWEEQSARETAWNAERTAAWNKFWADLGTSWDTWNTERTTAWDTWSAERTAAWNAWNDERTAAWNAFWTGLGIAWDTWNTERTTAWNAWLQGIRDGWDTWNTERTNAWNDFWNELWRRAGEAWNAIYEIIRQNWESISTNAMDMMRDIGQGISDGWNEIWRRAGEAWNAIWDIIRQWWEVIFQTSANTLGSIRDQIVGSVSAVGEAAASFGKSIYDGIMDWVGKILGAVGGVIEAVKSKLPGGTGGTAPAPSGGGAPVSGSGEQAIADAARAFGMDPATLIAFARHETANFTSGLYEQSHNIFSIKGEGPAGSVTMPAWEVINGQDVMVNATFRKYNDDAEAITDFLKLISESERYRDAWAARADPESFMRGLAAGGYATDPNWATNVLKGRSSVTVPEPQVNITGTAPSIASAFEPVNLNVGQTDWAAGLAGASNICGPYLAALFADAVGRPPSPEEASRLAQSYAWSPTQGMTANDRVDDLANRFIQDASGGTSGFSVTETPSTDVSYLNKIAQQNLAEGDPLVGFNTQLHYFGADQYNAETGQYHVGATGTAMQYNAAKAGLSGVDLNWLSIDQISKLGEGLTSVLTLAGQAGGAVTNLVDNGLTPLGEAAVGVVDSTGQMVIGFDAFGNAIYAIPDAVAGAAIGVVGATGEMVTGFDEFGNAIMAVPDALAPTDAALAGLGETAVGMGDTTIGAVDAMGNAITGLPDVVTDPITGAVEAITPLNDSLLEIGASGEEMASVIGDSTLGMQEQATEAVTTMGEDVVEAATDMNSGVVGTVGTMVDGSVDLMDGMGNTVVESAGAMGDKTSGAVEAMGNTVTSTIDTMGTDVTSAAGEMGDQVSSAAGEMGSQVVDAADTMGSDVTSAAGEMQSNAVDAAGEMQGGVTGAAEDMATDSAGSADTMSSDVQDILAQMADEATSLGEDFGNNLAEGLADGMEEAVDTVQDAAHDIIKAAEQAAKAAAQIMSPSRLFAEIGKNLTLGVAEGILENIPLANEAARQLVAIPAGIPVAVAAGGMSRTQGHFPWQQLPGFAEGGTIDSLQWLLDPSNRTVRAVGERGPEYVVPDSQVSWSMVEGPTPIGGSDNDSAPPAWAKAWGYRYMNEGGVQPGSWNDNDLDRLGQVIAKAVGRPVQVNGHSSDDILRKLERQRRKERLLDIDQTSWSTT